MNVRKWLAERTDREGGCLLWNRGVNSAGHPSASVDGKRARQVRRWVYERLVGDPGRRGVVMTCGNVLCLNHKHMVPKTASEIGKSLPAEVYRHPVRRAKLRASNRARAVYTIEQARQARALRAEGLLIRQIAERLGIKAGSVKRMCTGEQWAEPPSAFAR